MNNEKTKLLSFDIDEFIRRFCDLHPSLYSKQVRELKPVTFNHFRYSRDSSREFGNDYFLKEIKRKFAGESSLNPETLLTNAIRIFKQSEVHCSAVNDRLWNLNGVNSAGEAVIHTARLKLLRLLGHSVDWNVFSECGFSSGASFDMTRSNGSTSGHKFGHVTPTVTPGCLKYALAYHKISPLWNDNIHSYKVVKGNRITTVPKNNETDRPIAIEPTLNMFFQKGVGRYLRKKLRYAGIDLNDQTTNRKLALEGSVKGNLATIDLESASDTVSLAICELLLPPAWYDLLIDLRSPFGILPNGDEIEYSKISSMGNGFTFELESLIFWAISSSCSNFTSVYGDDIVVDTLHVHEVLEALRYCGFIINNDKTFYLGHFRESCGGHYFNGQEVTPVYHRSDGITHLDRTSRLILLANNLRRWIGMTYQPKFLKLYRWVVSFLPEKWRKPLIPDGKGDGALIGTFAECITNPLIKTIHGAIRSKVLVNVPVKRWPNDKGAYLSRLHNYTLSQQDGIIEYQETPRTTKFKVSNVLFNDGWSDPIL